MLHKQFALLETKADGESGEFTAIVSTFGNVDRVGDRIMPGAWTKTLKQWEKSGDPIPIILAHQWDDPMAHIGIANPTDVKQVAQGLQVTGKLDVDDNPVAKQVYKLMKRRSLKEFSIGYDVPKGGEYRAKDGANEITEINLAECGPCLKGIDPKTELQAVKSALHGVPDAQDQREQVKRLERDIEEEHLPAVPPAPPSDPEPTTAELMKELGEVRQELAATKSALEKPPRTVEEQRREATKVLRAAEEEQIPDVPEQPKAPEMTEILKQELQEVRGEIAEMRKTLEDLGKKAEATDKETRSRSVDPLRQQADAVALEQASGGESLRKPPHKATPKPAELIPIGMLKQRMRDEMLARLSEGIPE